MRKRSGRSARALSRTTSAQPTRLSSPRPDDWTVQTTSKCQDSLGILFEHNADLLVADAGFPLQFGNEHARDVGEIVERFFPRRDLETVDRNTGVMANHGLAHIAFFQRVAHNPHPV